MVYPICVHVKELCILFVSTLKIGVSYFNPHSVYTFISLGSFHELKRAKNLKTRDSISFGRKMKKIENFFFLFVGRRKKEELHFPGLAESLN